LLLGRQKMESFSIFIFIRIYLYRGVHCDNSEYLHCTLVRSPPSSHPHNPLPIPLKAIARCFIVRFHTCLWSHQLFPHLYLLHRKWNLVLNWIFSLVNLYIDILISHSYFFCEFSVFSFFLPTGTGVWTQGQQHSTKPFLWGFLFGIGSSELFAWGWLWTQILLICLLSS
jgi:hypothetical protein